MKKHLRLFPLLFAALLTVACEGYSEHIIRGTLYTDSTKTTPIAGDTLIFRETKGLGWDDMNYGTYFGFAVTDAQGRWGFQYVRNFDSPYMQSVGAKMTRPEYFLLITYDSDTLYWDDVYYCDGDTIELWPGCWKNPMSDTTAADTTKRRGGLL